MNTATQTKKDLSGWKAAGYPSIVHDRKGHAEVESEEEYNQIKNLKGRKILYTVWGYNMTLVEYWEVIKVTEKTALIRRLTNNETPTGFLSGTVIAGDEYAVDRDGKFEDLRVYKRTPSHMEEHFISKVDGFKKFYYEWDGKPKHYNHCD